MQLWQGRFSKAIDKKTNDFNSSISFSKAIDKKTNDFNSSISFDSRMYREDIEGSMAHADMLGTCGIIDRSEADRIIEGLKGILADLDSGALSIDMEAEDIHTFVEGELTARLGSTGKRLHTSRSRNDQVALDIRLTLRKEADDILSDLRELVGVICNKAEENADTVMSGYTHLQRAQPITFGGHGRLFPQQSGRRVGPRFLSGTSVGAFHCHGASVPLCRGDHPLVLVGIQIYRAGRRVFHRFLHHAAEEKSRYRGTGAR